MTACDAKLAAAKAIQDTTISITPNSNVNNDNNQNASVNFDDEVSKTSAMQRQKKVKAIFQLIGASIGANEDDETVACLGNVSTEMENFLDGELKSTQISHFNSTFEQIEKEHQDSRDFLLRGTKMPQFGKATMVALCHGNFLNKTLSTDTVSKLKDCFCPLHLTNPINNASHKTHLNEELEADKDSRTNQSSNAIKKQSTDVFIGGSTKNLEDLNIFLANNLTWFRTAFIFDDKNPETPKSCHPFFVEAAHEMSNALNKRNGKTWFNENSKTKLHLAIKFAS